MNTRTLTVRAGLAVATALLAALTIVGVSVVSADAQADNSTETIVIDGADRYETAAMVATTIGPDTESTQTLYIANGETIVDAVVVGATTTGDSKMLLVRRDSVPDVTAEALGQISHARLVFLGGDQSISPAVRAEVASLTCNYATAGGDGC